MKSKLWENINHNAILLIVIGIILPGLALGLGALNIQSLIFTFFMWIVVLFISLPDKSARAVDTFKAILIGVGIILVVMNFDWLLSLM